MNDLKKITILLGTVGIALCLSQCAYQDTMNERNAEERSLQIQLDSELKKGAKLKR